MGFLLFGGSVSVVLLALVLLLLLVSLLTSFAGPSLFLLELASFSEKESVVVVVVVAVFLLPGAGVFSIDEDAFFSADDFLLPGVVIF
jgi:hypothetical protein